jgi:uncharacterized membrane protein
MLALRYVYVLALVVWLGGMVILGVVVAPAIFQILPADAPDIGRVLAGDAFGAILSRFHYVAYASAGLLLVTLGLMAMLGPRPRGFAVRVALICGMLAVALYSGLVVLHNVQALQHEAGTLPSLLPAADLRRVRFDALRTLSTRLMMLNIAGTLVLLYWEAREYER